MVGTFISFDGGPGSGKGTMIKKTFEYIFDKSKKYDNILITDQPTNGPFGIKVRELIKKQKGSHDLAHEIFQAFVNDREWHIEHTIKPALENNFVVLADRYKYSGAAYQAAQGISLDEVLSVERKFLAPDLAIILDVEPNEALRRISSAEDKDKRKITDNFRQLEFVSNLQKYFLKMPSFFPNENIHLINANTQIPSVFEQIKSLLEEVLI